MGFRVGSGEVEAGDADRDRKLDVAVGHRQAQLLDLLPELLGDGVAAHQVGLWEDQQEFFAAVAAQHVGRAQAGGQLVGDPFQHRVAGEMAVFIVDRLEEVEVRQGHHQRPAVALRTVDLLVEQLEHGFAAKNPGQAFVGGRLEEADVLERGGDLVGEEVEQLDLFGAELPPVARRVTSNHIRIDGCQLKSLADWSQRRSSDHPETSWDACQTQDRWLAAGVLAIASTIYSS